MPRAPKNKVTGFTPKNKKCDVCGKAFERNSDLKRHLLTHGKAEDRPYKCQLCDFTANQKVGLETHMNSKHRGVKPHKCDYCEDTFADKSARHRHMIRQHGYEPADTKPKTHPEVKAGPSAQMPYPRSSKAVKRSSSPALDFLVSNVARKMSASSPFFVDAPVAQTQPATGSNYYTPAQGFSQQQFGYSFPQQSFYNSSSEYLTPEPQSFVPAADYCIPGAQSYTSHTPTADYSTPSSQSFSAASSTEIATPSPTEKSQGFCWGDIHTLSDTASQALPHRDLFYNNAIASYPHTLELEDVKDKISLSLQPAVQQESTFTEYTEAELTAWVDRQLQEFIPSAAPWSSLPSSAVDIAQSHPSMDSYLASLGSSF